MIHNSTLSTNRGATSGQNPLMGAASGSSVRPVLGTGRNIK